MKDLGCNLLCLRAWQPSLVELTVPSRPRCEVVRGGPETCALRRRLQSSWSSDLERRVIQRVEQRRLLELHPAVHRRPRCSAEQLVDELAVGTGIDRVKDPMHLKDLYTESGLTSLCSFSAVSNLTITRFHVY